MGRYRARSDRSRRRQLDDQGAAVVEFALVAPLLVLLIFGIFEFGFLFGQYLDVRHGAREAGRLASVNYNPDDETNATAQADDLIADACERMDLADDVSIRLSMVDTGTDGRDAGEFAVVRVEAPAAQITGFFAPVIDPIVLDSEIEIRLEQEATWAAPYTGNC